MADSSRYLIKWLSSHRKLLLIGVLIFVLIMLAVFAPGVVTINSSTPGVSIFIDSSTSPVSQGSLQFLSRGEHLVTVSKTGYYSVKQTINISPILYTSIDIGELAAASLAKDLTSGTIKINSLTTAGFCNHFNNSACIKASTLNDFLDAKKQLESQYQQDKAIPIVFYENYLSGIITFYQSDKVTINLLAQDDIDRPILLVTSTAPGTSHNDILQIISQVVGSKKYDYYLQYADPANANNNQMPNGKVIYWNDSGE